MAEMAAAVAAMDLGARHEQAAVVGGADGSVQRLVEARPAGAAFKFCLGREQVLTAAGADEFAAPLLLVQRTGAGALSAVPAQHRILRRRKFGTPFVVAMRDGENFPRRFRLA